MASAGAAAGLAVGGKDGSHGVLNGDLGRGGGASRVKGTNCLNSFTPDTQVELSSGATKAIEDVKVGEKILATDPETGKSESRTVLATITTNDDKDFTELLIGTAHGDASIITTSHHPFWSPSKHAWIDAGDLKVGMRLRTDKGATPTIEATRPFRQRLVTRNLTVDGLHTYYVLAGATPVLVHNDGGDDFNQSMHKALEWLESRGFKAEKPTIGKFGTIRGKPIGMQTVDGKTGFRIEFDQRNGAHINVWAGKEEGPHFTFDASEATVTKLQGLHRCH
ncbi:polymorphic toxin-type HINT domain-containing protein [Streptomyces sp. NBC_00842]|uniref:polymorphic toxin-type HINT domain-containing protein n=1 Tax=Streptomyces sp. NBC_00842 TaxID=2975848 RepID=UPI00386EB0B0|nr:polymorphic toxin-type HINT domain-containing protein [Streptomyces sp. NBC_00842]